MQGRSSKTGFLTRDRGVIISHSLSQLTYLRAKPTLEAPLKRHIDENPPPSSLLGRSLHKTLSPNPNTQFSGELQTVLLETVHQHSVTTLEPITIRMTPISVYAPTSSPIHHTSTTPLLKGTYNNWIYVLSCLS
jgi:hypothetical protein